MTSTRRSGGGNVADGDTKDVRADGEDDTGGRDPPNHHKQRHQTQAEGIDGETMTTTAEENGKSIEGNSQGRKTDRCTDAETSAVTHQLWYNGPTQKSQCTNRGSARKKDMCRCFNGQHYEDLYFFQQYFHGIGNGVMVELGALDGFSYSVSYFFETTLGWKEKGVLIEASPMNVAQFKSLNAAQKAWKKRSIPFHHAAVCEESKDGSQKKVTYVTKQGTGAGILEFMPPDQQDRNKKMCQPATIGAKAQTFLVPLEKGACVLTPIKCQSLTSILRQHKITVVDIFVLDVEGAEWNVLQTLDLFQGGPDGIAVLFFLIELDGKSPDKDRSVRCWLRQRGYSPVGRLDLNEVWVHHGVRRVRHCMEPKYTEVPLSKVSSCLNLDEGKGGWDFLAPSENFWSRGITGGLNGTTVVDASTRKTNKSDDGGTTVEDAEEDAAMQTRKSNQQQKPRQRDCPALLGAWEQEMKTFRGDSSRLSTSGVPDSRNGDGDVVSPHAGHRTHHNMATRRVGVHPIEPSSDGASESATESGLGSVELLLLAIVVLGLAWFILRRFVMRGAGPSALRRTWAKEKGDTAEMVSSSGL